MPLPQDISQRQATNQTTAPTPADIPTAQDPNPIINALKSLQPLLHLFQQQQ